MLRACGLAALCLSIAHPVIAQPPEDALRAAEEQLARALTSKDAATLERLLSAGFTLRGAPDVPRATWMTNALTLCWGDRFDISDFTVASRSGGSAIVTLLLTTHQDPQTCEPAVIRSLLTDLWVREADGWRLALRHSGPAGGDVAGQFAKVDPPPPRWERTGELSLVATGGNTDTQTLGAGAGLIWRPGVWTTRARAVYVRSATNDALSAESLLAELRQGRKLTPRAEIFARAEYLVDRFAGINDRLTVDAGFGWRFIDRAPHTLNLDGSFGATHESRLTGRDLTFAAATATAVYRWQISRQSTFNEQATISVDVEEPANWRLQNGVNLTVAMSRLLSVRLSHELKRVSRPVPGFRRTDTVLSVALVARF